MKQLNNLSTRSCLIKPKEIFCVVLRRSLIILNIGNPVKNSSSFLHLSKYFREKSNLQFVKRTIDREKLL